MAAMSNRAVPACCAAAAYANVFVGKHGVVCDGGPVSCPGLTQKKSRAFSLDSGFPAKSSNERKRDLLDFNTAPHSSLDK